ncbi:hypothetical protein BDW62DRAFT_95940 [Aspergillus aurantiobrunneus]
MANRRAIVTLHPLDFTVSPFDRSLIFTSESDRIDIGRSSKRENKNLEPHPSNALFDSRVMSRTHAILCVSLEKKLLYIRDPGSMHGTWLNKDRIPLDRDIPISNGDVLTFGVEVVRGSDTFPPLGVRCECQWLEAPEGAVQKASHQAASNTFCVPDDDDDDDYDGEVASRTQHLAAVDLTTRQTSESNNSSPGSDSEDDFSVVEVSSPMTSPLKNNDLKDVHHTDASTAPTGGPQHPVQPSTEGDVNPEQPLATPRMTPPSGGYESEDASGENQYYDEYFAHSSDEDSNVEPEAWDLEGEEKEDDDEQEQQEKEEAVEANALPDPVQESFEPSAQAPKKSLEAGSSFNDTSFENRDEPQLAKVASDFVFGTEGIPAPGSNTHLSENKPSVTGFQQREQPNNENSCSIPFGLSQPSFVTPSFQHSGRLGGQYQPQIRPGCTVLPPVLANTRSLPGFSYDPITLPHSQSSSPPYNDGPFANSQPLLNIPGPRHDVASSSAKPDCMPFMDPLAPMMPRTSCDTAFNPYTAHAPARGVRKSMGVGSQIDPPKKRKAAEIGVDPADLISDKASVCSSQEAPKLPNEDSDIPDAQPQSIAAILNASDSQLTPVPAPESPKEVKEEERPTKKIKTSHRGSLRSHATTAVVGAVLGAVGTIAALASLPPDYFA